MIMRDMRSLHIGAGVRKKPVSRKKNRTATACAMATCSKRHSSNCPHVQLVSAVVKNEKDTVTSMLADININMAMPCAAGILFLPDNAPAVAGGSTLRLRTLLTWAVMARNRDMVALLLEKGADPNVTPQVYAVPNATLLVLPCASVTPLRSAARRHIHS